MVSRSQCWMQLCNSITWDIPCSIYTIEPTHLLDKVIGSLLTNMAPSWVILAWLDLVVGPAWQLGTDVLFWLSWNKLHQSPYLNAPLDGSRKVHILSAPLTDTECQGWRLPQIKTESCCTTSPLWTFQPLLAIGWKILLRTGIWLSMRLLSCPTVFLNVRPYEGIYFHISLYSLCCDGD